MKFRTLFTASACAALVQILPGVASADTPSRLAAAVETLEQSVQGGRQRDSRRPAQEGVLRRRDPLAQVRRVHRRGRYGRGFASCRTGAGWSAPAAVKVEAGSVGFQIGGSESEVVLLVMNEKGMDHLLSSKFTIGGDATAAAGPVGRNAQAKTDASMRAEILWYSRSRGVFAGVSLEGGTLREDDSANKDLYGKATTNRAILAGGVPAPDKRRRSSPQSRPSRLVPPYAAGPGHRACCPSSRPATTPPTADAKLDTSTSAGCPRRRARRAYYLARPVPRPTMPAHEPVTVENLPARRLRACQRGGTPMRQSLRVVTVAVAVSLSSGMAAAQKLIAPIRGNAKVEMTKPTTKVSAKEIVTTFLLKNIEAAPIAGLKVEENWYDKAGNPVMGDTFRNLKPLQPGEVITVTFKTPRVPAMQRNQYLFSHANGIIKQQVVPKIDVPK